MSLPQDSQCSTLKTMQDKNLSTILRLPLRVWADSPDTQDTFKQQHRANSTSNQKSDTTRMHTLALCGTTNTLYPLCSCSSSWSTVQTPELSLHTASFAHMVIGFTHWDTHLLSSWQAKVWLHLPAADQSSLHLPSDNLDKCNTPNNWIATYPKCSFD